MLLDLLLDIGESVVDLDDEALVHLVDFRFLDVRLRLDHPDGGVDVAADLLGVGQNRVLVGLEASGHSADLRDLVPQLLEAGDALVPGLVLDPGQVHPDGLLDGDQRLSSVQDLVLQLDH